MKKTKKINVLEYAKLQTIMFGLIGLLLGVIYSFGGLIIDALVTLGRVTTSETPGLSYGTVLAFNALWGMPLIFIAFGFVTGIVGAWLYNWTVKIWKGISLDVGK